MPLLGQVKLSESTRLLLTESHRARDRVNVEEGAANKWLQIQNKKCAQKWRAKQPNGQLTKFTFFLLTAGIKTVCHCWSQLSPSCTGEDVAKGCASPSFIKGLSACTFNFVMLSCPTMKIAVYFDGDICFDDGWVYICVYDIGKAPRSQSSEKCNVSDSWQGKAHS